MCPERSTLAVDFSLGVARSHGRDGSHRGEGHVASTAERAAIRSLSADGSGADGLTLLSASMVASVSGSCFSSSFVSFVLNALLALRRKCTSNGISLAQRRRTREANCCDRFFHFNSHSHTVSRNGAGA